MPLERDFVTVPKRRAQPCQQEGSPGVGQEPQGARGRCGQEPSLWCPREAAGEAEEAGLGLASLDNSSGFWGMGAAAPCLGPGPGVFGQVDSGPERETP